MSDLLGFINARPRAYAFAFVAVCYLGVAVMLAGAALSGAANDGSLVYWLALAIVCVGSGLAISACACAWGCMFVATLKGWQ